ncbi:hypothetical protein [Yersinia pseudotuberculosis]
MIEANTQKATVADSGLDWVANTDKPSNFMGSVQLTVALIG